MQNIQTVKIGTKIQARRSTGDSGVSNFIQPCLMFCLQKINLKTTKCRPTHKTTHKNVTV